MTTDPTQPDPPLPSAFEAGLARYSANEQNRFIAVSENFAIRVSEKYLARVRWMRRLKSGTIAIVAMLAISVGYYLSWGAKPAPTITRPEPVISNPTSPKLSDSFLEASDALASLSHETRESASIPTGSLFGAVEQWQLPAGHSIGDIAAAKQSITSMQTVATSGVEPLTTNTRRAIKLFLRDAGLKTSN
jgi:hypothetical protein